MTKSDFLNVVLRNLGRLHVGQAASSTDTSAITVIYNATFNNLQNEGLVAWGEDDDLPDWAVHPMKKIVSSEASNEFALPEKRRVELKMEGVTGFAQLLRGINQDYSPETYEAEYF